MKHEWRKNEKGIYLPKNKPQVVDIPEFSYFMIRGEGDPNSDHFPEYIGVLYSLSYAVRMSPKKGYAPMDYFEYTVYPLEGVWDLNEEAKRNYSGEFSKSDLVFNLMIRQPGFVTKEFADFIIKETKKKKPHPLLDEVVFTTICDGKCVQMMHLGSYDNEPESFRLMDEFANNSGFVRKSKQHREIYLNDARKTPPEKLKTVLRFMVEER